MKIRIAILFLLALPVFAADPAAPAEMRKLDWLAGEWKGEASVLTGPGKGEVALQTERVQSRQGGKLLVVEGLGKRKLADGTAGDVVHDAFGVIWYDEQAKKYHFNAWTAQRGYVDAWFEVNDDGSARWGFRRSAGQDSIHDHPHREGRVAGDRRVLAGRDSLVQNDRDVADEGEIAQRAPSIEARLR